MSSPARRVHYTYAEYLALEDASATKHEYFEGEIYAMAGGTPDHAALAASIIALLGRALTEGCRTYTSDLRVRVTATGLTTYPDAAIVCGPTLRDTDDGASTTSLPKAGAHTRTRQDPFLRWREEVCAA